MSQDTTEQLSRQAGDGWAGVGRLGARRAQRTKEQDELCLQGIRTQEQKPPDPSAMLQLLQNF